MNQNHEGTKQRVYKTIMIVILTAFFTFMVTSLSLYSHFTKNPIDTATTSLNNEKDSLGNYLGKIKSVIYKNYLWKNEISEQKLQDGAAEGMVKGLGDDYTEYIPASEMKEFKEEIEGSFYGVGIYMVTDTKTNKIIVYYPIPGSPAEKAGIKPGDIIVSVDGKEYTIDDFDTIAEKIRGKEGTTVKLVIERDGKQMDFELKRQKIELNPLTTKMFEGNIGYIKLPSFDSNTSKGFAEKVDSLVSEGAKSLIIDLRNNGGGIVDEATQIADYFLDKNKIIISIKDNSGKQEITNTRQDKKYSMPVVILVNENTASASEILTVALKDNDRAKVIGTKTYGKGVIQTVIPFSDGSGLKITTAEYFTPKETEINGKGINPNIESKLPSTINAYSVKDEEDTQLKKAIEELKK